MSTAPGNVFYPQPRDASSLSTRIDADGKLVKVEVREDEDQNIKLQEIVDLLVAAGYFRARIKGLSPFDKVVGGMTWCIETCNFDVDIDLLFQENLTIGQKIALTEKIVAVLPQMKCPHRIEPHQIQGLDFIHIFPVIQWLVKKSVETRQEMGDMVRLFAISQFDKQYSFPSEQERKSSCKTVIGNIQTVKETYRPQRRFRRRDAPPPDEESRVQSTLLEYGYNTVSVASLSSDNSATGEAVDTQQLSPEAQKIEEQRIEALMQNMSTTSDQEGRLTAGVVGNIVNLQVHEIAREAERYAELQAQRIEGVALSPHARASAALERQNAALEEKVLKMEMEKDDLENHIEAETNRLEEMRLNQEKMELELKELESLETDENKSLVRKLQSLVALSEELKKQEQEFREQCKFELTRLEELVRQAESSGTPDQDTEQVAAQFEEERNRVQALRLAVAKKNRAIAILQRQLDEVPGRAELAQYQRRFLELYNQVAAKHKETKQFYTLYNTLDDTKLYLSKELGLLNSILDNYSDAMLSPGPKEQFMNQFEAIVEGIKQNKAKVEARRNEERHRRDQLSQELLGLVEQQRRYVAAVRQLTIECRRNENLLAQLRGP